MRIIDIERTSRHLKKMIKESDYTVKDIQKILRLEKQSVYSWMSDKKTSLPSLHNAVALAAILGCYIDDLLVTEDVEEKEECDEV